MSRMNMKNLVGKVKRLKVKEIVMTKFQFYILKANDVVLVRRKDKKEMMQLATDLSAKAKVKLIKNLRFKPCKLKWDDTIKDSMGYMISRISRVYPTLTKDFYNEVVNEFVLYFLEQKAPKYNPKRKCSQKDYFTFLFNQKIHEMTRNALDMHTIYTQPVSSYTNTALYHREWKELVKKENKEPIDLMRDEGYGLLKETDYRYDDVEDKLVQSDLENLFIKWLLENKDLQANIGTKYANIVMSKESDKQQHKSMLKRLFNRFYKQTYGKDFDMELVA